MRLIKIFGVGLLLGGVLLLISVYTAGVSLVLENLSGTTLKNIKIKHNRGEVIVSMLPKNQIFKKRLGKIGEGTTFDIEWEADSKRFHKTNLTVYFGDQGIYDTINFRVLSEGNISLFYNGQEMLSKDREAGPSTADILGGESSIAPAAYAISPQGYESIVFVGTRSGNRTSKAVAGFKKNRIVDLTEEKYDYLNLQMEYEKHDGDILVWVEIANDNVDGSYTKLARINPKTCEVKWDIHFPEFGVSFPKISNNVAYIKKSNITGTVNLTTGKWTGKAPR